MPINTPQVKNDAVKFSAIGFAVWMLAGIIFTMMIGGICRRVRGRLRSRILRHLRWNLVTSGFMVQGGFRTPRATVAV